MGPGAIRRAFEALVGQADYRRFVRCLNTDCLEKGRLRFWQERLWERFVPEELHWGPSFSQIQAAFRVCDVHDCELTGAEPDAPSGARNDAYPFAQGPLQCERCREARAQAEGEPAPAASGGEPLTRDQLLAVLGEELASRGRPELLAPFAEPLGPDGGSFPGTEQVGLLAEFLIRQVDAAPQPATDEVCWAGDDPSAMLRWVGDRVSARKARLFACACCRRIWPLLRDERARRAVEVAERYADGEVAAAELAAVRTAAEVPLNETSREAYPAEIMGSSSDPIYAFVQAYRAAWQAAAPEASGEVFRACVSAAAAVSNLADYREDFPAEHAAIGAGDERPTQANLLRCVLGSPLRPAVAADAPWLGQLSSEVRGLAAVLYRDRLFGPGDLAALADGLEEAGCANEEVLGHLRGDGPHARGCWALDLVLGRE